MEWNTQTQFFAMENLATTYHNLKEYTESEKLKIQILDSRRRILGLEHPHTIRAMTNLAVTYEILGKYEEAVKLVIQAQEVESRNLGVGSHYTIPTMSNVKEDQDT